MFFADRIKETTTTAGTGTITVPGTVVGPFRPFWYAVLVGDPLPYGLLDANGVDWEIGTGTLVTTTTISRDTILSSSTGSAISLSSGTHTIFLDFPAERANKAPVFGDSFIDYVVSGLVLPSTSGNLTGTLSAGTAYVIGQRVVKGAQVNTYAASKDTYVDINNVGTLTYSAVANGAGAPALVGNSIRLGKVVTGASTITSAVTTGLDSLGNPMRNLVAVPSAILTASSPQIIATATLSPVTFDTEVVNNNAMHSIGTNPSRITIVTPGKYTFAGYFLWNDNVVGVALARYFAQLIKNGSGVVVAGNGAGSTVVNASYFPTMTIAGEDLAAAGDYYEIQAYQASGGNVSTFATGNTLPRFSASRTG